MRLHSAGLWPLGRTRQGLGHLDGYVCDARYAYGSQLTLADCGVFSSLHLCEIIAITRPQELRGGRKAS